MFSNLVHLVEAFKTKWQPYPADQLSSYPKSCMTYGAVVVLLTPKNQALKFLLLPEWYQEEHLAILVVCLLATSVTDEEDQLAGHFHHCHQNYNYDDATHSHLINHHYY
jgi:hypothetical protein